MTEKRRTEDSGVFDKTTGLWMTRVAAYPLAGQYVFDVERGYTFADADAGHALHFVGDPWPLTAEEIADLTPLYGDSILPPVARGDYVSLDRASYERIRNALPRLLDEVERARALLKRIEWNGVCVEIHSEAGGERTEYTAACPACGRRARGNPRGPHEPGCELAALLGVVG